MRLKFANWIRSNNAAAGQPGGETSTDGLLGYVAGFTNAPVLDDGFIEGEGGALYAKTIELACEFTVLHTHDIGWTQGAFRGNPDALYPYGMAIESASGLLDSFRGLGQDLIDILGLENVFGGDDDSEAGRTETAAAASDVLLQESRAGESGFQEGAETELRAMDVAYEHQRENTSRD
tara:strand:+ start:107 stop:640 length:534 start_codon:yes stop_codon:yes gene_type:complete